ncbi:pentapeptide repeat-containing protein [Amycolatopsis sp.]|uniref:pentapeptide repeat-containing protein n=1 Tax=Amycolatopsis sp. TaxID=37632 RepID=UPI002DFAEA6C|nr:pentapeptide repeat-containing protein [Amycolatopsis sp.]
MKLLKSPLAITFAVSLLLLIGVGSWLLTDPATSRSEALKTGGLAGGAVVALYALWLNDRRRRVEERRQEIERQRHELEMRRTEQDRERISDERFAKAIELMGNDADQVRVGAMHALAGVARSRTDYTQTVLDVLCSYLHRPFTHPQQGDEDAPRTAGNAELERELQVRLTAQRLIVGLLPKAGDAEAPSYDLDLTGAVLEYFDLRGHKVGDLLLRYAKLCNSTNLSDCEITGRAYFTAAATETGRLSGRFYCQRTKFHEQAWFSGTEFQADADFEGTTFDGEANFKGAVFHGDFSMKDAEFGDSLNLRQTQFDGHTDLAFASPPKSVDLYNTLVDADRTHELPHGWQIETLRDGRSRLTLPT